MCWTGRGERENEGEVRIRAILRRVGLMYAF